MTVELLNQRKIGRVKRVDTVGLVGNGQFCAVRAEAHRRNWLGNAQGLLLLEATIGLDIDNAIVCFFVANCNQLALGGNAARVGLKLFGCYFCSLSNISINKIFFSILLTLTTSAEFGVMTTGFELPSNAIPKG